MCKEDLSGAGMYVVGVVDKWKTDSLAVEGVAKPFMKGTDAYDLLHSSVVGDFCMPGDANVAMTIKFGFDWAAANPDKGDYPAANAVLLGLREKWPRKVGKQP
jgi:hypothetical protein